MPITGKELLTSYPGKLINPPQDPLCKWYHISS